ncbi:cell division protein FtsQ/DivIB [Defluviimonas sp. WL0002]|uniref:Cell division protein FtsQ n=1 Tax=Albidovulum marisflavi TaxID=2984159 RepID=A0ABT2ZDF9_9RHOB|nr:cell division protein FtsQ/DivIB [Defluviimonas sp. WL0002]MCV2869141.1 cell division protein FtsQ/DivIB [Defluviimonas sp. WL0002]
MWALKPHERERWQDNGRADPAPSRLAYRLNRLWLTPLVRSATRVGLPALVLALATGLYLKDDGRRAHLASGFEHLKRDLQERPEFMVTLMRIDGASEAVAAGIRAMLPVELPASSFRIDLETFRATIAQIDAVASVDLRIRPGGVLQVDVTERQAAILWRTAAGRLEMLDAQGHRVATLTARDARPDLAVIAGEGAEDHVQDALVLIAHARPLAPRLRGLILVGERRWDLVLDRDQRIMLPETDPIAALNHVIELDRAEDLLSRDVAVIDMRNDYRPTIRLSEAAIASLRGQTVDKTKVNGQ